MHVLNAPLRTERAVSLASVIGLHALAALALLSLVQPAIMTWQAEPVHIELVTAAPPAPTPAEAPKPLPTKAAPPRKPAPQPTVAPAVVQTAAPVPAETPHISAAPAPQAPPRVAPTESTPPSHPPAAAGPGTETVQAPRFDADYLRNPSPAYPPASRSLGEEGRVILRVQVSEDGQAQQVLVDVSSGSSRLDRAAREAVAQWRFVPARQGQQALVAWVKVPIIFELKR
ncbi:MAG: energy transducer TonB [Proteobacteria bacterium]|nr:energy transducer TonB [Pseudomonadota bacterium]